MGVGGWGRKTTAIKTKQLRHIHKQTLTIPRFKATVYNANRAVHTVCMLKSNYCSYGVRSSGSSGVRSSGSSGVRSSGNGTHETGSVFFFFFVSSSAGD